MAGMVNSGYGGGGSYTNASGPSGMDVSPYLAALLERERLHLNQQQAQPKVVAPVQPQVQYTAPRPQPVGGGEGRSRMSDLQEELLAAQVSKAKAEAHAMSAPAPMKLHPGGAGYTSAFNQIDTNALTGAQRAQFLPQGSSFVGGGDSGGGGGSQRPAQAAPQEQYRGPSVVTMHGAKGAPDEYHYNPEDAAYNQALYAKQNQGKR